ncbi:MAG: dihydrofolate reductase family protein [Acidimicrobiales bacterium]
MSRIVVTEFMSLDVVMEDPGGAEGTKHGGWTFKFERGPEGGKFKVDELMAADALLLGRVTYQAFAAAWPSMGSDEFGERMNSVPKYVVSSTLKDTEATWGDTTVLRGDVVAEITKLKSEPGGDLLVEGSSQLVHTLAENGLVDEYRLMVFPIILGSGKRVFPSADAMAELSLTTHAVEGGTLLLTYKPS